MEFVKIKNVKIDDDFWNRYEALARGSIIPYQWKALNDEIEDADKSGAIQNFKIAAKVCEGEFHGFVFQDSDLSKWLEAASYSLATHEDKELEKRCDEAIDLIAKAQREDGYIDTYFLIKEKGKEFTNFCDWHELYCAGHMIEAAVAYAEATGKTKLLDVVCRFTDLIDKTIGPEEGKLHAYPGHPEFELALIKLYEATGEERYLRLCEYVINERGKEPNFFQQELEKRGNITGWGAKIDKVDLCYCQAHKPVRKQAEATGHAVRAGYLYTGMAGLAAKTQDESLVSACKALWNNVTRKQMYITGGIGSQGHGEAFSFNYHMPNDTVYNETCAAISLAFFAKKMLELNVDSEYSDVLERVIYNGSISGMSIDGTEFFYVNPLEVWQEATQKAAVTGHVASRRRKWFGCACCPPNLARMITSLGTYIYSSDSSTVYAHLFIGSEAALNIGNQKVTISQKSSLPWGDGASFALSEGRYTFAVRIPSWSKGYTLSINGSVVPAEVKRGYAYITRDWKDGDTVSLAFNIDVDIVVANPHVRADAGKGAIVRGPIVYCLESIDNTELICSIRLKNKEDSNFTVIYEPETLCGVNVIEGDALIRRDCGEDTLYKTAKDEYEPIRIRAVPYALWGNRNPSEEMAVWLNY
ncbi:MAG: glycoside hydrolase family 127 protein [Clostridia bacterium]|nr:glycoside hydrolase family 127 protein [Clostridia bacterium]